MLIGCVSFHCSLQTFAGVLWSNLQPWPVIIEIWQSRKWPQQRYKMLLMPSSDCFDVPTLPIKAVSCGDSSTDIRCTVGVQNWAFLQPLLGPKALSFVLPIRQHLPPEPNLREERKEGGRDQRFSAPDFEWHQSGDPDLGSNQLPAAWVPWFHSEQK